MSKLRITEIFYSLQGETDTVGLPTVFVRLTGCPLRCNYCDTEYAFKGGQMMNIEAILAKVASYQPRYVTVTGGEPLAQPNCHSLLTALCDRDYGVSLETSGAFSISKVDKRVIKIVDFKTPASNEVQQNLYQNIAYLLPNDQVKFVICNNDDYDWAKQQIVLHRLAEKCKILFSPSHDQYSPTVLAEQILADNLPVRLQIQLHKYLWGDVAGK